MEWLATGCMILAVEILLGVAVGRLLAWCWE